MQARRKVCRTLRFLYDKYRFLLDEYDTPLQEAYVHGYWEEMVSFMGSLFNSTFKTNPYLERAILTGITRISKESIFSDLNNLDKQVFAAYWANTSSNELVGKLIREGSPDIKMVMEDLLKGGSYHTCLDEQVVFCQLDRKESAVWSLLLAGGYLRVERFFMNMERGREEYDLVLTNKEVRIMFAQMIENWFLEYTPAYNGFVKALLKGIAPERIRKYGFAFEGKRVMIG